MHARPHRSRLRRSATALLVLGLVGCALAGCQADHGAFAAASSLQPGQLSDDAPPVVQPAPTPKAPPPREVPGCSTSRCTRSHPRGEFFVDASFLGSPALGGGIGVGQVFRRSYTATWAIELEAGFEDLGTSLWGDEPGASGGEWAQIQGGVKASFNPRGRGHPTARLGLAWFRATEDTKLIPNPGDYVGLYAGVGYEWDVTPWFTTGPEVSVMVVAEEKETEVVAVPQFQWHFIFNF